MCVRVFLHETFSDFITGLLPGRRGILAAMPSIVRQGRQVVAMSRRVRACRQFAKHPRRASVTSADASLAGLSEVSRLYVIPAARECHLRTRQSADEGLHSQP